MELINPLSSAQLAVSALDEDALARFARWFESFHTAAWDAQIEKDFADPTIQKLFLAGIKHSLPPS